MKSERRSPAIGGTTPSARNDRNDEIEGSRSAYQDPSQHLKIRGIRGSLDGRVVFPSRLKFKAIISFKVCC